MDDWGRGRSFCMSCLSGTALPGPNSHSCMQTQEREVYAGWTPPPNPSLFSWITCYRFNLHLALRWCILATDDGAPTSSPPTIASDVSAGLLKKEEAASEKMNYKDLFQVWLQQRLCAGASADAHVVQLTRKERARAIFSSRRARARPLRQESQLFTGMEKDVIAGGAGGMGPCPPPQHQPPGGAYAYDIHCISM